MPAGVPAGNHDYGRLNMTGASRVAPGLRFAPCPRSAFGRPLTLLDRATLVTESKSSRRLEIADRVETFFTSSRAPASPAPAVPASCLRPGGTAVERPSLETREVPTGLHYGASDPVPDTGPGHDARNVVCQKEPRMTSPRRRTPSRLESGTFAVEVLAPHSASSGQPELECRAVDRARRTTVHQAAVARADGVFGMLRGSLHRWRHAAGSFTWVSRSATSRAGGGGGPGWRGLRR